MRARMVAVDTQEVARIFFGTGLVSHHKVKIKDGFQQVTASRQQAQGSPVRLASDRVKGGALGAGHSPANLQY